jgi:hypothetical protein
VIYITIDDYLGPYRHDPDVTPEVLSAAEGLLIPVNALLTEMVADGCTLLANPYNRTHVSGGGNGGFRPQSCPIGAPHSKHKTGHGVDIYDPYRELAKWCYAHPERMQIHGLSMEDARWTPSWLHLQDLPPGPPGSSWRQDFIPDSSAPKAAALPGQVVNGARVA